MLEDAALPLEWNVIELLVEHHLDRESERVATAWQRAIRAERSFHAATTSTDVLLLLHLHESVANLDDVDHLRLVELIFHRLQLAAATRAHAIGIVESKGLLHDR